MQRPKQRRTVNFVIENLFITEDRSEATSLQSPAIMSGPETEEHKLRRLLYTGSTSNVVHLRGGLPKAGSNNSMKIAAVGGIKKDVLGMVATLVGFNPGNTNLALQHCLAARNNGQADKRALLLVLSGESPVSSLAENIL